MKITTVLTAVNDNPRYTRFIPLFIYMWKRLYPTLNIRIIYIGSELPANLAAYSDSMILFPPIEGVSTVYTAQTIRILYPALLGENETAVITDMDMLPANSSYFSSLVQNVPQDTFLTFRSPSCVTPDQIAICYNAASTSIWKKIFGISTLDDIRTFLKEKYDIRTDGLHGGQGWCSDQILLRQYVMSSGVPVLTLNDAGYSRLDIYDHKYDMTTFVRLFKTANYSDAHLYSHECPWTTRDLEVVYRSLDQ